MTMLLNELWGSDNEKKLKEFEDAKCIVKREGTSRLVNIPVKHYSQWKKLKLRREQTFLAGKLVPRSLFVSVVSQYDAFLGKLLRIIFLGRPELLVASKREITFSELVQFGSIDIARDHIIEKEIDSVLRMSHVEQFKWMENRFEVKLTKFESWPTFVELTQRRNLFVHVDGIVSKQYLSECAKANCEIEKGLKEGNLLRVSGKYYDTACSCVLEVGIKLATVLWRKLFPDELREAGSSVNELTFDLIERKKFQLAISLLRFAVSFPKHSDESQRLRMVVNLAQAYKWNDQLAESLDVLDGEDWSAVGDEFKLAEAVLRSDWTRAFRFMRRIGTGGAIQSLDYRDWPVFQEFRLQPKFGEVYQEIFGEPFPATIESEPNISINTGELEPIKPIASRTIKTSDTKQSFSETKEVSPVSKQSTKRLQPQARLRRDDPK